MAHRDPEKRREYWRKSQQRHRSRVREDAHRELQAQLRASASAGMGGGTLTTCRFDADDSNVRVDPPGVDDWNTVRRAWVAEVPVVRLPDAIERLCVGGRQVTMLALLPTLSAPQDWPVLLGAVEAARLCVLVRQWIRQRPAVVLGFGVDPVRFMAAWQSWGVVLHGGVPKAAAVQQEPPPHSQPRSEPAPSKGVHSPWGGAAQPVAEDVPSQERPSSDPQEEDEIYRIHREVFGKDLDDSQESGKKYDEIDTVTYNLAQRGLAGAAKEKEAVAILRRRHKLPDHTPRRGGSQQGG